MLYCKAANSVANKELDARMSFYVRLDQVARLVDHTHFDIPRKNVVPRKGPYPYYGDLFERFMVDDFALDAPAVIFMAAAGKVLNTEGGFRVALEHGKCGSSMFAHTLVPYDPDDATYITACLASHPNAIEYIAGATQLQTLDELAVLRIELPWPAREARQAFTERLEAANARLELAKDTRAKALAAMEAAKQEFIGSAEDTAGDLAQSIETATLAYRAADSEFYEATYARDDLINNFMQLHMLEGFDCSCTELPVRPDLPAYSDAKAERARAELRNLALEEAKAKGGLAVGEALAEALGVFAPFVLNHATGLEPEDVAWELAPMAVLRAVLDDGAWSALMQPVRQEAGKDAIAAALDSAIDLLAKQDPCFSLMPMVSYQGSVLSEKRLAEWLNMFDGLKPWDIDPSAIRAVFEVARGAQAVPSELAQITGKILTALVPLAEDVYMPCANTTALSDIPALYSPSAHVYAQCEDNASLLQMLFVRGVAAAQAVTPEQDDLSTVIFAPIDADAAQDSALVQDVYPNCKADVVLIEIPWNTGEWLPKPPAKDDPRWVLGTPTRMRSTYAWIQQALCHLKPNGFAFVLLPTFELQTQASVDRDNRKALVEQQRVHAVIALPPRIWGDERPPYSLAILGTAGSAESCLMVDATGMAVYEDDAVLRDNPQRKLTDEAADAVCDAVATFIGASKAKTPERSDSLCVSALVPAKELMKNGALLAPWLYV